MKKIITLILALVMLFSLVACDNGEAAKETETQAQAVTTAAPEYTAEQQAVAAEFTLMVDKFNASVDKINADDNLLAISTIVDTMNSVSTAITEADALFADPANLTDEVLATLKDGIKECNSFVDEIESMITIYAGKETVTVSVEVVNNSGVDFSGLYMSPANDTEWGGSLLDEPLMDGESGTTEMTFTADTLVWDLLAEDAEGTTVSFMGLDFTNAPTQGAKIVFAYENGTYTVAFAQ